MKKQLLLFSLLITIGSFALSSCGDDNDDDATPKSSDLFDKWWYSKDITADLYIHSNGNFEQHSGNPSDNNFFAEWTWANESELTIKVEYLPGQGPGQPTLAWLRFSDLTATSVNVEQSLTGEAGTFAGPFEYSTIE